MSKGRVREEHRNRYVLKTDEGDVSATVRGKLHLEHALGESVVPKVGDYVEYEKVDGENAVITSILPRGNSFVRRAAHDGTPQVIVTNIDVGVIVQGLDGDFNPRRLERYLKLVEGAGATPVIVLNKADKVDDIAPFIDEVEQIAGHVDLYVVEAKQGVGMEELKKIFKEGETAVLIGSSGAGKSTIINWLLRDNIQTTQEVREGDDRGKHTTTSRQLFDLPNGAMIIDTPGMRELSLLSEEEDNQTFSDIAELASMCKFRNCDHEKSAGCAILEALENGELDPTRFGSYLKLQREQEHEAGKVDVASARVAKTKAKQLAKKIENAKEKKGFEGRV